MHSVVDIAICRKPALQARGEQQTVRALAHALRDHLLCQRLACDPTDLDFGESEHGKPILVYPAGWHFNLSHSHGAIAVAVANDPLGIDLEYAQRQANWSAIAKRQFCEQENVQLDASPAGLRNARTVQLWTAKEAWVKASGVGVVGMDRAPTLAWRGASWQLETDHCDTLQQFRLWDDMLLSVHVLKTTKPQLRWHEFAAQEDEGVWSFDALAQAKVESLQHQDGIS